MPQSGAVPARAVARTADPSACYEGSSPGSKRLISSFTGFIPNPNSTDQSNNHDTISQTNPHLERIRVLAFEADGRNLTSPLLTAPSLPGHVSFADYGFLELRGATTLDREDLAFLAAKGCLSVPEESLLDEFVRQYFLQIHPGSPVIDEAEFWRVYRCPAAGKKISLFVFQAILFAGSPYVSAETIRKCGWSDKRNARNTLYKRSKALYDLHGEDRAHAQAQGSVILTLHTSAPEPQISSLWLTRAIQNAMIIGCQPGPTEEIDPRLRKRLWWSIILRDRSLCLGLRRRPQVTSFEMMVSELPDEEDFADEIATSAVYSREVKRMMLRVLQEQCRLAVLLSEMITFVFASHGIAAPSLTLEQFQEELVKIARTKSAMQRWEACSPLHQWSEGKAPEAVTLFTNFTYMYYQTARIDLAHYEALLLENHLMFSGKHYLSRLWNAGNTLHDAMDSLIRIMEYFGREGRAQNLPLSVLAYVGMPLVLTAIDLKLSPSASEMDRRRRRLDSLGEIVRHSSRVYDVTDFVTAGTNHILRLAYMTAQHLFLRWDHDQPASAPAQEPAQLPAGQASTASSPIDGMGMELTELERDGNRGQRQAAKPHLTGRANTWHEAFLRYPRAYLLISTSVDYSLSVGRLPYDAALPELVRCIPPIGIGIQLPWTISCPREGKREGKRKEVDVPGESRRSKSVKRQRNESVSSGYGYLNHLALPLHPHPETPVSATGTEQTNHDVHTLPDDVSVLGSGSVPGQVQIQGQSLADQTSDFPAAVPPFPGTGSNETVQGDDQINLDYLYIEPDGNGAMVDADFDGLEFQAAAAAAAGQGFDPLISSWVQDYFEGVSPRVQSPGAGMEMMV
ncbi:hypothetical protein BJX61DRAFT_540151 [Aspergillus egyptiacus]|nr:hypothetical protein BJX61DRAFT_540151 [Aspergillus egyptiacus]